MKKSGRFWWLHGAILLSAVIGCKNCGSTCSSPGGAPPSTSSMPYGGSPTMSGGPMSYSANSVPVGTGTPSTSSFSSAPNAGYNMPGMSSGMSPGVGGVGR